MTNRAPKPGAVHIPRMTLRAELDRAEIIKREMTALLLELELAALHSHNHDGANPAITTPGGWRHDPAGWAKRRGIG